MTPIETKLNELEQSVVKAKAFERNRQRAVAHGMKPDIPITLKIETAEMLIAALREAVCAMRSYQKPLPLDVCPNMTVEDAFKIWAESVHHCSNTITKIENILNGEQK